MRCILWKLHQNPKKNYSRFIIRIKIVRIIIIINIYILNIITYLHYILILMVNIRCYFLWVWRTWWWISDCFSLFHDRWVWSHLVFQCDPLGNCILSSNLITNIFINYISLMLYIYIHIYNIIMITLLHFGLCGSSYMC